MLPQNLTSSYTRYKQDTDAIATWLATTAKLGGYESEAKSKSAKKRAAKKNAGKATDAQSQSAQSAQRRTYTIPIKDFTTLAEFIAEKDGTRTQVPPRLAALLDRTIKARQFFSAGISPLLGDDEEKLESDDRHAFFLRTLEKVREILRPIYPRQAAPVVEKPTDITGIVNMFEKLQVEETSEAFNNAPDVEPKPKEDTYKAEQEGDDLMECFMAFQFLMHDLHRIRMEVRAAWQGLQQGMHDLVAVSITTNTAIDLAGAMEDDLQHLICKHGGSFRMLQVICAGHNINIPSSHPRGDDMNFRQYQTADLLFWPAAATLKAFCDVLEHGQGGMPEMKKGHFGVYDPSSDRSKLTTKQKYTEDKILLLETLPEFWIHCRALREPHPTEDALTRGLRDMFATKKITLSTILATTCFLDLHHIMRNKVDYGFQSLADTADYVVKNLNLNMDFHKDLSQATWPKENDLVMQALASEVKMFIQDDLYHKYSVKVKRINIPEPFQFFRKHPWLCGLWRYNILIRYHELSIVFVNAWGALISCAHLYNAVQSENMLQGRWQDMNFVTATQGAGTFFIGEPPKNTEDYLMRFCTVFGLSASAKAALRANRKKKGLVLSKQKPQGLRELGSVLQVFKERFCEPNGRRDLRREDIDKIIDQCDWNIETEDGYPTTIEKDYLDIKPKDKRSASRISHLPVHQLLATMDSLLQAEMPEVAFDYLCLHRSCWRLLRFLKDKCRDQLINTYGPDYLEKEDQLPFIVGWILMTASKTKELGTLVRELRSKEVTSRVLRDAAGVVSEMVSSGAGEMVISNWMPKLGVNIEFEEDEEEEEEEE